MKVLWLSHNVPYPPVGGVLQRNYHLVRGVARRAELHLVALRQRALCPDEDSLEKARQKLSEFCTSVHTFDIDWETSPAARATLAARMVVGSEPYDVVRYHSRELRDFLKGDALPDMDITHFDTLGLTPYRRFRPPGPAVLNHHNIESQMLSRRAAGERRPFRRAVLAWQARRTAEWERRHAPSFDRNLVVSGADRERLTGVAPGAPCTVIANGTDTEFFSGRANRESDNHRIVMVGTHGWYPNRDAALYFLDEIWPLIIAREPQASWIVIGSNPDPRVVAAARLDARIRVLGFVDDLRPLVEEAAVFVCPFRDGGGTRLKVLDALAMRKAIVSTSVGVEGVPLKPGHHYLLADTADAFADHVLELFRNPTLRARLGEAGREVIETRFDWTSISASLFEEYERCISRADETRTAGAA